MDDGLTLEERMRLQRRIDELEAENARLREEVQGSTRSRNEVLAVVAHDLRNTLNFIQLSVSVLAEEAPEDDRRSGQKQLRGIQRGVEKMTKRIAELLEAAAVEETAGAPPGPPCPVRRAARSEPRPAAHDTVLVVDDDEDACDASSEALERHGYHVIRAPHGRAALDLLRDLCTLPALILLDLQMPVMNGWDFVAEKNRDPVLAEIPVLLMSSRRNLELEAAALAVAGFLHKPLDVRTLLVAVQGHCPV